VTGEANRAAAAALAPEKRRAVTQWIDFEVVK
jgi:hypothetical protein